MFKVVGGLSLQRLHVSLAAPALVPGHNDRRPSRETPLGTAKLQGNQHCAQHESQAHIQLAAWRRLEKPILDKQLVTGGRHEQLRVLVNGDQRRNLTNVSEVPR